MVSISLLPIKQTRVKRFICSPQQPDQL